MKEEKEIRNKIKRLRIGMTFAIASLFPALLVINVGFQMKWYYGSLGIIMFVLSSVMYFKITIDISKLKQEKTIQS